MVVDHINKMKEKDHMIISIDVNKKKNQHPLMIKTLKKLEMEGNILNMIKAIYEEPTANIILHDERLKDFPL